VIAATITVADRNGRVFESLAMRPLPSPRFSWASVSRSTILVSVLSRAAAHTSTIDVAQAFIVSANTSSPWVMSIGTDSSLIAVSTRDR